MLTIDGGGTTIAHGAYPSGTIRILDTVTGIENTVAVPLGATNGQKLTEDGKRFFFRGNFVVNFGSRSRVGFLNLDSNTLGSAQPDTSSEWFSVDRAGDLIVFQALGETVGSSPEFQYFLYDVITGESAQLTDRPNVIDRRSGDLFSCPDSSGSVPLISADGSRIVIATSSTLGLSPEDDDIGCYIHVYDSGPGQWRTAATLPSRTALVAPSLTADGTRLAYLSRRLAAPAYSPALIDLESGSIADPAIVGLQSDTFDALISRDGQQLIFSSQDDLDPEVDNSDGNLELFHWEIGSSSIVQITDTIGGITGSPSGCAPYNPVANWDASVVASSFSRISVGSCQLSGAQRLAGEGVSLRRFRTVERRDGNSPSYLIGASRSYAVVNEPASITFEAADPDGDRVTIFAQTTGGVDLPTGVTLVSPTAGFPSAEFTWLARQDDVGLNRFRIIAFDEGGGSTAADLEIAVCAHVRMGVTPISEIFGNLPTPACSSADLNIDFRVSAADIISVGVNPPFKVPPLR